MNAAVKTLKLQAEEHRNTVHTNVISMLVSEVSLVGNPFFENLMRYENAMTQARILLKRNIITEKEYADIDEIMANKYGISLYSIFRDNA